jgi:hypothetical protein
MELMRKGINEYHAVSSDLVNNARGSIGHTWPCWCEF